MDSQDGEIGLGIVADHFRGEPATVGGGDADRAAAVHDVAVGEDEAVGREDEAGPGASARAADLDLDHRGAHALGRRDDGARVGVEEWLAILALVGDELDDGAHGPSMPAV